MGLNCTKCPHLAHPTRPFQKLGCFVQSLFNPSRISPAFYLENLQAYRKVKRVVQNHLYTLHLNLSIVNMLPHCFISLYFSTIFFFLSDRLKVGCRHQDTSHQHTSPENKAIRPSSHHDHNKESEQSFHNIT